jgi:chromosome transmission fidelity protein 1
MLAERYFKLTKHSQLSQFVKEIRKTVYSNLKCITLGSRKNLCIHSQVKSIASLHILNDKCLDLQDSKEGCPFTSSESERQMLHYADQSHVHFVYLGCHKRY